MEPFSSVVEDGLQRLSFCFHKAIDSLLKILSFPKSQLSLSSASEVALFLYEASSLIFFVSVIALCFQPQAPEGSLLVWWFGLQCWGLSLPWVSPCWCGTLNCTLRFRFCGVRAGIRKHTVSASTDPVSKFAGTRPLLSPIKGPPKPILIDCLHPQIPRATPKPAQKAAPFVRVQKLGSPCRRRRWAA